MWCCGGGRRQGQRRLVGGDGPPAAQSQREPSSSLAGLLWFAFDTVESEAGAAGLHQVRLRDRPVPANDEEVIRELEALLITVLGTRGQNKMKFQAGDAWAQVPWWEQDTYLTRVALE